VLLVCLAGLAGCGGRATDRRPPGATVFANECAACHSVIGNESLHRQGGDLVGYRMTREQLVEYTREMPVRHRLSPAQLSAVVDYVLELQRRNASR
jgi:mono/diheme cytochrome c family protein